MNKPAVVVTEKKDGKRVSKLADSYSEAKQLFRKAYKNPSANVVVVYLISQNGLQKRKIKQPAKVYAETE